MRTGQHSRAAQSTYVAKKLHLCAKEHQTLKEKTVTKHGLETLWADITCIPLTQVSHNQWQAWRKQVTAHKIFPHRIRIKLAVYHLTSTPLTN